MLRLFIILSLIGVASINLAAENTAPDGFALLFNGTDFKNWAVPENDGGHWKVEKGIIDYDGKSLAKSKDLWSEKEYADFTLMVDWRWSGPAKKVKHPHVLPDGTHKKGPDGKDLMED